MPDTTPADLTWCRERFRQMSDGGVWAAPRSGLIFTRRDDALVLTGRMPWTPELADAAAEELSVPPNAEALRTYQDLDYGLIRSTFEAAGVTVRSELA